MPQPLPVRGPLAATFRLTWLLAAVAVATSVVGIAHGGDGYYEGYPAALAGLVGQDIATIVIGVALLVGAALLARRGSTRGLLMWAGALFYVAYSYFFFVVGAFNPGFVLYVLIVAGALYGLLALLLAIDADAVRGRFASRTSVRPVAALLFGIGLLFALMWGGMSLAMAASGQQPGAVAHGVMVADGCVLLPALLATGWNLWHRAPWGYAAAGILLVKVALTGGTLVFTTAINTVWTGVLGGFDIFLLVLFGLMAIAAIALGVPYFAAVVDKVPGPSDS